MWGTTFFFGGGSPKKRKNILNFFLKKQTRRPLSRQKATFKKQKFSCRWLLIFFFFLKNCTKNELRFPDTVLNSTFGIKKSVGCKMVRALFQIREHAQMIDTCLDDDHVGTKFME